MIFYFLIFVLGTVVGSFLNVVVLRLNTNKSLIKAGSGCFSCGHRLGFFDLIPILSFLIQKGKCRYCRSKVSWQYPLVELAAGFIFVLTALKIFNQFSTCPAPSLFWCGVFNFQTVLVFGFWFLVWSFLIAISVYDLKHQIIPDKLVYPFIASSLIPVVWNFAVPPGGTSLAPLGRGNLGLFSHLLSGAVFFGFFALLWFISRGKWMGFGDAKLALGIGFLLGPTKTLAAFLFSFWLGGALGILLLLFKGKNFTLKTQIPFGPFLAGGAFLAFLFGEKFLDLFF